MKKFIAYLGFAFLSLTALVLIGAAVVIFMSTRLERANERLEVREEERSQIEDTWIAFHKGDPEQTSIHIQEVTVTDNTGTIDWEGSEGASGTVHFKLDADGTFVYLDNVSEFPKYPSYPKYFRDAIHSEMN